MKLPFKKVLLAGLISCLSFLGVQTSHSATVRSDVNYQEFRDFAENKGRFTVGATNIQIKDKNGKDLGVILNGMPMPDFSSTHRLRATSTLIDPQYVLSVAHNHNKDSQPNHWHYHIQFGGQSQMKEAHHYSYAFVDTNDNPTYAQNDEASREDYQVPRLHKLVTEVIPTAVAGDNDIDAFKDSGKYVAYARLGSGIQNVLGKDGTTQVVGQLNSVLECQPVHIDCQTKAAGYQYLIGGELLDIVQLYPKKPSEKHLDGKLLELLSKEKDGINNVYTSAMANWANRGDSGSPIFGYNKETKQWELIALTTAVMTTIDSKTNEHMNPKPVAVMSRPEFHNARINEDKVIVNNHNSNQTYQWSSGMNGTSNLSGQMIDLTTVAVEDSVSKDGFKQLKESLNRGKTVEFTGQVGSLELTNSINQGAGALYFNNDFTVRAKNQDTTWLGAGVSVAKGKTVTWQVKNPEHDRLSKVGEGTLLVNGMGENKGNISVGDGVVILNQQADSTGKKQAFNQVGIVSGRPTVKLMDSKQIDPNKLYFGYRGGRLDLNGNDLNFEHIQNVDEGARIVNHNGNKSATITVVGEQEEEINSINSIYKLNDDWYMLRGENSVSNTPQKGESNLDWVYLGATEQELFKKYEDYINYNHRVKAFNGVFGETDKTKPNGQLNVTYDPSKHENANQYKWLLSGGSNLNGNLNVKAGEVILSGRPTPYALDIEMEKNDAGRYSIFKKKQEIFKEDDWINRQFNAKTFKVENEGKLYVGRNVSHVNANFDLSNQAFAQLGFVQGKTPVCIRSDYHGETSCEQPTYSATTLNTIPTTQIKGNLNLKDNSQVTLGKAHLTGSSVASQTSKINMLENSQWTMTKNSQVGNLAMTKGSQISLNTQPNTQYHTLTIAGNLTGEGRFNYLTNLTENQGDKVIVQGTAEGKYGLYVNNAGTEPVYRKESLTLLHLQNPNQATKQVNVELLNPNKGVDLGAYRYTLQSDGANYYLYNPYLSVKEVTEKGDSVKADALKPYEGEISTKGSSVKHELPVGHLAINGTGVKHELPVGHLAINGTGVKHELPVGHLEIKGTGVKHELPVGHLEMKGTGVTHQLPEGKLPELETAKGTGVKHELPVGHLEMKGSGVTHQLPEGKLPELETAKGTGVKHELPVGHLEMKGDSVKAEPLPTIDINKIKKDTEYPKVPLSQAQSISRYTNAGLSDLSAQINSMMYMGQGLNHYLLSDYAHNVWLSVNRYHTKHQSDLYRQYTKDDTITQIGSDVNLELKQGKLKLGTAWSYNMAENQYADHQLGKAKTSMLSLYSKFNFNNHNFMTFDTGYGVSNNQIISEGEKTKFQRKVATTGLNFGRTFQTSVVDVQPSVGVRYHYLSDASYQLNGANIKIDNTHLVSYQAGLQIEKAFPLMSGLVFTPSLSSYYVNTPQKQSNIWVNGHQFNQAYGRYHSHHLGLNFAKPTWETGLRVGYADGNEINRQTSVNLLFNYKW